MNDDPRCGTARYGADRVMLESNTHGPTAPQSGHCGCNDEKRLTRPYSKVRGVSLYFVSLFLLWFFVAPMIAPTDVPPEGAPPIPLYLVVIQVVVCHGVPFLFVYVDFREQHLKRTVDR